eukprot:6474784-Amphidinium_carterae.1
MLRCSMRDTRACHGGAFFPPATTTKAIEPLPAAQAANAVMQSVQHKVQYKKIEHVISNELTDSFVMLVIGGEDASAKMMFDTDVYDSEPLSVASSAGKRTICI